MTYTAVSDFKYGMDRRRIQASGVPGTLWTLENAVITRGGDIERTKKWVLTYELPEGTNGLFSVRNQKFVFGSATSPVGLPAGIRYVQLIAPGTPVMDRVLDVKAFDGKLYAIASYDDGNIYHFYDGTRVSQWDGLADAAADFETVAARFALTLDTDSTVQATSYGSTVELTATTPGTGFTISGAATDNGGASTPSVVVATTQANVAEVDEVKATGTITITDGTLSPGVNKVTSVVVDGDELLISPVDWLGSNSDTANSLAVAINNNALGYSASAVGAIVTISAPAGAGATMNTEAITVTVGGNVTTTTANFASGVTYVAPVAQISTLVFSGGSFDAVDMWAITLNAVVYKVTGRASAMGTSAYIRRRRVYSTAGSLIRYCKLGDPTDWTDAAVSSGAGFINISNEADGADSLVCMSDYNEYVAIFAKNAIVTYQISADAEQSQIAQSIGNTGALSSRSVVAYGANDVFYLDTTGIRSLRARDTYNAAYASDVGSAFDTFVQEVVAAESEDVVSRACAVIEARDGRYFLALGSKILILSQFPASKIVAWSYVTMPGIVTDMVRVGKSVYARVGDDIYVYGGLTGDTYPDAGEFPVFAETPFISAKDPAGIKTLEGFDMAAENTWQVRVLPNPNNREHFIDMGKVTATTYSLEDILGPGQSSHFALRFECEEAGRATLSSIALHHTKG